MPELPEIFLRHHDEIEEDRSVELDPAWDRYVAMEIQGMLHVTTVRDGARLVGYYMAIIAPQMHHKTRLAAYSDMFYLREEYRFGWTGVRLFIETDKMLKRLGVKKSYLVTKAKQPITMLLKRIGYVLAEKVYIKLF